jgi:glutamate synthase domain-containing protein 2
VAFLPGGIAMHALLLPLRPRFLIYSLVLLIAVALGLEFFYGFRSLLIEIPLVVFIVLAIIGTIDIFQTRHAVLRNYPLSAHIRFILEEIRPEIRQYFLESEKDGTPFSRDKRALVYQRSKRALDKRPFGTQNDVYASGFE